jgi:exosortase
VTRFGVTTAQRSANAWWLVIAALLLMYVPTFMNLFKVFADTQYGSYGPIVLVAFIWLVWREREVFNEIAEQGMSVGGAVLFGIGLVLFVLGRSQSFYQLEVGSLLPLLTGLTLMVIGGKGMRPLWFPILMLIFVVPVPGSVLDQLLILLKQWVSTAADTLLHVAGFPTARSGVVLSIGPYQLLMADACAGLNSIITLSGLGLIYVRLNWTKRRRIVSFSLLLSILPIALMANVIRVMLLMLTTYWWGESAGSGLHRYAGYGEILFIFGCLFVLDGGLSKLKPALAHGDAVNG